MGDGTRICDTHGVTYDWRDSCGECEREVLKEELDRLRAENAELTRKLEECGGENMVATLADTVAECGRYREALEQYAKQRCEGCATMLNLLSQITDAPESCREDDCDLWVIKAALSDGGE
jgi:hypothetical protein